MTDSVVKVSDDKAVTLATGFVVDKDESGVYIATCGHVINRLKSGFTVNELPAELVANEYENGLDLALLYARGLRLEPLMLTKAPPAKYVSVIGYSLLSGVAKRETYSGIRAKSDIKLKNEFNALKLYPSESISAGHSGSPVICETSGRVVGIITIQTGDDRNYAICAEHLEVLHDVAFDESSIENPALKGELMEIIGPEKYNEWSDQLNGFFIDSLQSFTTQKNVWVEPRLHSIPEDQCRTYEEDNRVSVDSLIRRPRSLIVQARQQFGLSCLARNMVERA
ncbi:MAG: serine protease [Pseudomonadota bacterium]